MVPKKKVQVKCKKESDATNRNKDFDCCGLPELSRCDGSLGLDRMEFVFFQIDEIVNQVGTTRNHTENDTSGKGFNIL